VERRPRERLAVAVAWRRQERLRQLLEAHGPLLAGDQVEPVEDQPGIDVGRDLGDVARRVLDLEAHRLRRGWPAEVLQRLVERGAGETGAASAAFYVGHAFLSVWRGLVAARIRSYVDRRDASQRSRGD
jgi:hypothetical protein